MLRQVDGIEIAPDAAGVEATLSAWLAEPERARAMGQRARAAILGSKGATERTMEVLRPWLERVRAGAVNGAPGRSP